ncbi:MAG: response regulator [Bacteroidota bacterium]
MKKQLPTVLVAEDDADDRLLIRNAFEENARPLNLRFVNDGNALLAYLRNKNRIFRDENPRPSILLLDLNMPDPDGRLILRELKSDPELKNIPTLVFTGATTPDEVLRAYQSGVNSFIAKPNSFAELVTIVKGIEHYWFDLSEIPGKPTL